ncbi:MAG: serine/threonine protein phosphatase [Balneola sp.]|nr:serine/threonine protein phosphatase [Balneola sp.]MBO6652095.1 serine/threonine protein phosphatase [Balneola sp.]MBO6711564.1 serine/threonine protein phosphatase [Balneola sp.]MBO6799760.1 serine/threonine protein phosphatase [Balneola sp.]MBO6870799.1 serine/threonine protein phosphatase [Balneola sp.]
MNRKIIIGDIHGCLATFEALLNKMNFSNSDTLYLVGDYIDRGPSSKGVIDKIITLKEDGHQIVALRGNHEQMLIDNYIAEVNRGLHQVGDKALLQSFGIRNLADIPEKYIHFCDALPLYHQDDEFIVVHAGLRFVYDNPFNDKEALLWARNWYQNIDMEWLGSRIVIHGHTMQSRKETELQFLNLKTDQVIDIDCGAVMSQSRSGLGYLCGFDFTNQELIFQENVDN